MAVEPPPFRIHTREKRRGYFHVALEGRLDSVAAERLEAALEPLLASTPELVQLDMADVGYISSAGVGVVFLTLKRLRGNGGRLALSRLQAPVRKVFEIAAALPEETVFASVEEADRYYDAIQRRERG